jgi:sulfotransferase family protein
MPRPFFLFGALRSGTTVFRLMLRSHEQINAPGETDFVFDFLARNPKTGGWTCDLDNLRLDRRFQSQNLRILNSEDGKEIVQDLVVQLSERAQGQLCLCIHRHADRAAALFPHYKVIHIVRDPRDVASSCIGMGWAGNTYFGINPWIETETNWDLFKSRFDANNIFELRFEDLIVDPKAQLMRVCHFLELPFSPAMLSYSRHSTYAPPDPSAAQRWKTTLAPRSVALVEVRAEALLLKRGYALSGNSLDPPRLGEKLALICGNKFYKWKFGMQYYGTITFFLEKITSKFVKPLSHLFRQKMNEIERQKLSRGGN